MSSEFYDQNQPEKTLMGRSEEAPVAQQEAEVKRTDAEATWLRTKSSLIILAGFIGILVFAPAYIALWRWAVS